VLVFTEGLLDVGPTVTVGDLADGVETEVVAEGVWLVVGVEAVVVGVDTTGVCPEVPTSVGVAVVAGVCEAGLLPAGDPAPSDEGCGVCVNVGVDVVEDDGVDVVEDVGVDTVEDVGVDVVEDVGVDVVEDVGVDVVEVVGVGVVEVVGVGVVEDVGVDVVEVVGV